MNLSTKEKIIFDNFEALKCNPTDNTADILLDNSCDPD